jgi:putative transcriptional regulator
MNELTTGKLLIADPFLKDPHFLRSVVLLCAHDDHEGSVGLVINRPLPIKLAELTEQIEGADFPVYYGGPVETNTLHIVHAIPNLIQESSILPNHLYWGGNFEQICELIRKEKLNRNLIRFYLGYSGWSKGQLEEEMTQQTWLTGIAKQELVFHPHPEHCWKEAVLQLGAPYAQMIHYPIDPQLN